MDDTFAFRSTGRPLRRRVDPVALKAALAAFVVVLTVGLFARWVIASERASELHKPAPERVGVQTISGLETVASQAPTGPLPEDVAAQKVASRALWAAQKAFAKDGSFADAGPGQLTPLIPWVTFTDGPSQAPSIASIAMTDDAWAAAVLSDVGSCWQLRVDAGNRVTYGNTPNADPCTGTAALDAADRSWP
ncbi:MAG: hypothetical protein ABI572_03335 [Actinomycetota bacterium]